MDGLRVTDPVLVDGRRTRLVNVGAVTGDDVEWLVAGVDQALQAVRDDVEADASSHYGRARPLVGMPVFGTGRGGFGRVRGHAIARLLELLEERTADAPYDVVLSCLNRSDYSAVQSIRRNQPTPSLPRKLRTHAERLGDLARNRQLVLFLGAGVSMAAGLPSWEGLLTELAKQTRYRDRTEEVAKLPPPDAAELLLRDLRPQRFKAELRRVLQREHVALGHALLASLHVGEAVTTNFDQLYESAAETVFGEHRLAVLPWDRATHRRPWLLKMHGDLDHGLIVLGREDYLRYFEEVGRPLASVVQAMLLTRHMLFVGFSLADENFIRLAREVSRLLSHAKGSNEGTGTRKVGTALTLQPDPARAALWQQDLHLVPVTNDRSECTAPAARQLEIFLDYLAMITASDEYSYLLDHRYAALADVQADSDLIQDLQQIANRLAKSQDAHRWAGLQEVLRRYGADFTTDLDQGS